MVKVMEEGCRPSSSDRQLTEEYAEASESKSTQARIVHAGDALSLHGAVVDNDHPGIPDAMMSSAITLYDSSPSAAAGVAVRKGNRNYTTTVSHLYSLDKTWHQNTAPEVEPYMGVGDLPPHVYHENELVSLDNAQLIPRPMEIL